MFKKDKIYAYENSNGDKGIIIATSFNEAKEIYEKEYPKRKIVKYIEEYDNGGAYLYEIGAVKKSTLFNIFPW